MMISNKDFEKAKNLEEYIKLLDKNIDQIKRANIAQIEFGNYRFIPGQDVSEDVASSCKKTCINTLNTYKTRYMRELAGIVEPDIIDITEPSFKPERGKIYSSDNDLLILCTSSAQNTPKTFKGVVIDNRDKTSDNQRGIYSESWNWNNNLIKVWNDKFTITNKSLHSKSGDTNAK